MIYKITPWISPRGQCCCSSFPVDWSKGDPPNLIGVVLRRNPNSYTIGTRAGIIRGTLARNQIEFVKFSGPKAGDVPAEHYTVRELVQKLSICGG